MTILLVTTVSILAIAGLAWAARKLLRVPVCPICAGVVGTWLGMLAARHTGFAVDASMLSMLLGASVAGAAVQLERHLPPGRSPLLWKALFVPTGFVAAYGLAVPHWSLLAAASVTLALLTAAFLVPPRRVREGDQAAIEQLQNQMKRCC